MAESEINPIKHSASVNIENLRPFRTLTEQELSIEKKLLWTIDTRILPLICLSFFLSFLDRSNYSAARLQHMQKDLNLSDTQYQTGLSVYYIGIILLQVPSNILLNYFGRPSLYIGVSILGWSVVTGSTASVHGFSGILACRILLGVVEAPLYPGIIFYLSKWYTKSELSLRISICISSGLLANAFGSLIAAGVSSGMDGLHGLSAWKWLYIIEGIVSTCSGIAICFFLPDFPHTWKVLSPGMKRVAIRRLTLDAAEVDVDESDGITQIEGLKLAFADIKIYIIALNNMCIFGAASFQNFFPTLIATLGYGHIVSLLLVVPPYVFVTISSCLHGYLSDHSRKRFWYIMYPVPISIAGFILFMTTDIFGVRYFATFLMIFLYHMNSTINAWAASSISRPTAKRAAAYGFISTLANSVGLWTPFTYRTRDAPHYRPALGICVGLVCISAVLSIWLRLLLVRENRRLGRLDGDDTQLTPAELVRVKRTAEAEGIDILTAMKLRQVFRYTI